MYLRTLILLFLATAVGGCELGTGVDLPDLYALRGIGETPLPIVVASTPTRTIELVDGSLHLRDDGGFVMSGTRRITDAGAASREEAQTVSGTYHVEDSSVLLTFSHGTRQVYAIQTTGARLHLIDSGPCRTTCIDLLLPYVYEPVLTED